MANGLGGWLALLSPRPLIVAAWVPQIALGGGLISERGDKRPRQYAKWSPLIWLQEETQWWQLPHE